jgi:GNAT superfamily N-acetyltransferase
VEYLIKQYALEPGAWEIQYIEEYFGEFPRRKTAAEIIERLRDRESLILMAEASLPDDPGGAVMPVSYKIVHEIRGNESIPKLRDLVGRLGGAVNFDGRRILYQWIGGTRRDWRGQGHFRALTEESEVWAKDAGFEEVVVKTKNRYYDMRAVLAQLQFNVVKLEPNAVDCAESKVYLSKLLPAEIARGHRSVRTVVYAE